MVHILREENPQLDRIPKAVVVIINGAVFTKPPPSLHPATWEEHVSENGRRNDETGRPVEANSLSSCSSAGWGGMFIYLYLFRPYEFSGFHQLSPHRSSFWERGRVILAEHQTVCYLAGRESGEGGRTNATSIMRCSKAARRNTDQILGLK